MATNSFEKYKTPINGYIIYFFYILNQWPWLQWSTVAAVYAINIMLFLQLFCVCKYNRHTLNPRVSHIALCDEMRWDEQIRSTTITVEIGIPGAIRCLCRNSRKRGPITGLQKQLIILQTLSLPYGAVQRLVLLLIVRVIDEYTLHFVARFRK